MPKLIDTLLRDERLTSRLDDAEARMLIEWLVDRAERGAPEGGRDQPEAWDRLRCRVRAIVCFVVLWCQERAYGPALQLAATERFAWPLPTEPMDGCDLLDSILAWENRAALCTINK
jgi:hypothetical protein